MSKLDELINELCPDGVEYRELWSITTWDKRFNSVEREKQPYVISYPYLLAADLFKLEQPKGDVFLLSTGEKAGWTTEKLAADYLCDGEVVSLPWGKSRPVKEVLKYYKGKFVTADNRIATSNDTTKLLNRYLYYWMLTSSEVIDGFYRGSGIKHPSMNDVLNLKIPLPPLPVQEEIVRILDNFTKLTTELATELTARKKQYAYYRDSLFAFSDDEFEWRTLGDIGEVRMCKRILKEQTLDRGDIPFYKIGTFGKEANAYISRQLFNEYKSKYNYPKVGEVLLSASGTIGRAVIFDGQDAYFQDSNIVWIENNEAKVLNKYLYYFYKIAKWYIAEGGTIQRLYNENLKKTNIPIPYPHDVKKSLTEQQRIVDILDRFDTLCNDISNGLPAEIKARQQQYEYYRDKLFTFPKAELEVYYG